MARGAVRGATLLRWRRCASGNEDAEIDVRGVAGRPSTSSSRSSPNIRRDRRNTTVLHTNLHSKSASTFSWLSLIGERLS